MKTLKSIGAVLAGLVAVFVLSGATDALLEGTGIMKQPFADNGTGFILLVVLYRQLYVVIRNIPRGRVATYGQVAELAGIPGGARVAAASLKVSRPSDRLPWQRVIGKAGKSRGRIARSRVFC